MKAPALILAVSLIANVVLVAVTLSRRPAIDSTGTSPGGAVSASPGTRASASPGVSTTTRASGSSTASKAAATADSWHAFHGGDLKGLADRLRASGFPPNVIRSVISSQIQQRLAARREQTVGPIQETPFWLQNRSTYTPEQQRAMRALNEESTRLMREALGDDWRVDSPEMRASYEAQYGNLPMEKIERIQKLRSDYNDLQQEIYAAASGGVMLAEDRAKLTLLEKELRADTEKLLTPAEFAEYDIRTSSSSMQLRSRLATFKPTEEEFRALYPLQKAMDDEFAGNQINTAEESQRRQARQREYEAQMMALVPADRAVQLKLAIDPAYNQVNRVVTRFNLPAQAALDVVAAQQEAQQQVVAIRNNRALPAPERDAQLAALQQQAQAKVAGVLGARGYEAYQEYGGQWLQNLVPRPRPAPTAAPGRGGSL